MKALSRLLILIIIMISHSFAFSASDGQVNPKASHRIGVISLFPEASGIFFDDRIRMFFGIKSKSLFPEKGAIFHTNVNNLIVGSLVSSLAKQFKENHELIALPPLNTADSLTGYMIEGSWGEETRSVNIKGLEKFFQNKNLDKIIAIAPVTYYVPNLNGEGSGIEVLLSNTEMFFSCCYAIIIFAKKGKTYEKEFSSIKQVYSASRKIKQKNQFIKHYTQACIEEYYLILKQHFIPHMVKQFSGLLNNQKPESIFIRPKKPLYYYLSH